MIAAEGIVAELREETVRHQIERTGISDWRASPDFSEFAIEEKRATDLVDRLDEALADGGFHGTASSLADGEPWCVGTHDTYFAVRPIFNGLLQPIYRRPLVRRVPERVVAFLIAIGGEKDILKREHHDFVGWHYHYLNRHEERSDVILSWDAKLRDEHSKRGLYSEKHAEKSKRFSARPSAWSERKRESIHAACVPDLGKWDIELFRNASDEAQLVWPKDAVMTARTKQNGSNATSASRP